MTPTQPTRTNLRDIALAAGVSVATVSRVLSDKNCVSPETRRLVLEVAKKVGFSPRVNNLIALILPDTSNPFFAELSFLLEQGLEKNNYHLLTSSSEGRSDRELQLLKDFTAMGVKGLIYVSSGQSSETLLSLVATGNFPVVVLDRRIAARNLDFVTADSRNGTLRAVDYLIANGHQRLAYLKGLTGTETARERFESFRDALKTNRLEFHNEWIFEGDYSPSSGRTCAERLIEMARERSRIEQPTALLAANDMMAIGLLQRLQEEGWQLPQDLSVIGFDNVPWSEWCYPALTTIAQPIPVLVRTAMDLLLDRIKECRGGDNFEQGAVCKIISPRVRVLEPVLVPRASVAEHSDSHSPAASGKLINMDIRSKGFEREEKNK